MIYQATAKHIRVSTRKVRLVADMIRGLTPAAALKTLSLSPKSAAKPISDVLKSALANAEGKKADSKILTFKTIEIMGGPAMKRFHAVSRGMAHAYKKRMTHIRIILTDDPGSTALDKNVKQGGQMKK